MKKTFMLLQKLSFQKSHVTPQGNNQKSFMVAEEFLNVNKYFGLQLDGKSVQDRYERLQKSFDTNENKYVNLSIIGKDIS